MGARTLKSSQPLHTLSALAGREQRIEKTDLELLQGERGWTERIMGEGSRCRGAPYPRSPRALHSHRYAVTVTATVTRKCPQNVSNEVETPQVTCRPSFPYRESSAAQHKHAPISEVKSQAGTRGPFDHQPERTLSFALRPVKK